MEKSSINEVLRANKYRTSIRKTAGILEIFKSDVQRFLKLLKLTPFKLQTYQKLYTSDNEKRLRVDSKWKRKKPHAMLSSNAKLLLGGAPGRLGRELSKTTA